MHTHIWRLIRSAGALALAAATLIPMATGTRAAGERPLLAGDFIGLVDGGAYFHSAYLASDAKVLVAGTHYARAVELLSLNENHPASASINTQRLAGYVAVRFALGLKDSDDTTATMTFTATADGAQVYRRVLHQGALATQVTIPFGTARVIAFRAIKNDDPKSAYTAERLILGNPAALSAGSTQPAQPTQTTPAGTLELQVVSPVVAGGGQQTVIASTAPNASVTVVIDYPNGLQAVAGPRQAGGDGHLVYTWAVPGGVQGAVHVTVDSAGKVTQGSFVVQ